MESSKRLKMDIQKLDLSLDFNAVEDTFIPVLKAVKPEWDKDNVRTKILEGGLTNRILCCHLADDTECRNAVAIRVFGTEMEQFVDRHLELIFMQMAEQIGCGPKILALFNNGMVCEYCPGSQLKYKDSVNPKYAKNIAELIAKLHVQDPAKMTLYDKDLNICKVDTKITLFDVMRRTVSNLPMHLKDPALDEGFQKIVKDKDVWTGDIEKAEKYFNNLDIPLVPCHNDLHILNMIYDDKADEMKFIDYEFGSFNYETFEFNTIFGAYQFFLYIPGVISDDDSDMEPEIKRLYMRTYLEAKCRFTGDDPSSVTEEKVDCYMAWEEKTNLLSTLFWLMWALRCLSCDHEKYCNEFFINLAQAINSVWMKERTALIPTD